MTRRPRRARLFSYRSSMPYVDVPSSYHVVGRFEPYIWHGYLVEGAWPRFPRYVRDRCIGPCDHPYQRLRRAPDGALWDAGGSPIGFDIDAASRTPDPDWPYRLIDSLSLTDHPDGDPGYTEFLLDRWRRDT